MSGGQIEDRGAREETGNGDQVEAGVHVEVPGGERAAGEEAHRAGVFHKQERGEDAGQAL